jgi:hypothetical protein
LPFTHLHIISFDIPYPPDYGGVIDVFYKIKALHEAGVKIHLHCFEYGRELAPELEKYCEEVFYYKRQMNKHLLFNHLPYIVVSRRSELLVARLLKDNHPILFEGLHSCYHLGDERLKGRKLLLRNHNIEHDYYSSLAKVERRYFRKIYFKREAVKLLQFEKVMSRAAWVLAISRSDEEVLSRRYSNVMMISAFHPNEQVVIQKGMGDFALYHGNLEVGENNEAALFLTQKVFAQTAVPLIIAGKNPSAELKEAIARHKNITLCDNIPTEVIDVLIRDAQINILPTFQSTGIKLKLLAALFNGRHCIVNSPMVRNTGLEELCSIEDDADSMRAEVERLFRITFGTAETLQRERILCPAFSNQESTRKLLTLIQ